MCGSDASDGDNNAASKNNASAPISSRRRPWQRRGADGSVSCRPVRSVGLGLHPMVVVPGGVTGGRERMAVSDVGLRIDGGRSDVWPRRRQRVTLAPGLEEGADNPRSTHHHDKGHADGGPLHRLTMPLWAMAFL